MYNPGEIIDRSLIYNSPRIMDPGWHPSPLLPIHNFWDIIDALLIYDFLWNIDGFLIYNIPQIMDRAAFVQSIHLEIL